jgi:hypothetical protein
MGIWLQQKTLLGTAFKVELTLVLVCQLGDKFMPNTNITTNSFSNSDLSSRLSQRPKKRGIWDVNNAGSKQPDMTDYMSKGFPRVAAQVTNPLGGVSEQPPTPLPKEFQNISKNNIFDSTRGGVEPTPAPTPSPSAPPAAPIKSPQPATNPLFKWMPQTDTTQNQPTASTSPVEPLDAFLSRMGGAVNTGVQKTQPHGGGFGNMDALSMRAAGGQAGLGGGAGFGSSGSPEMNNFLNKTLGFGGLQRTIGQAQSGSAMGNSLALRRANDESMDSQMRRLAQGEDIGAQRVRERGEMQKQWEDQQRFPLNQAQQQESNREQPWKFAEDMVQSEQNRNEQAGGFDLAQRTGEENLKELPMKFQLDLADKLSKITGIPRETALDMLPYLYSLPPAARTQILNTLMPGMDTGDMSGNGSATAPPEQQPTEKASFLQSALHGGIPALTSGAGWAGAAALAPETGAASFIVPFVASLLSAWLGGKAVNAVDPSFSQKEPNPYGEGLGSIAGAFAGYKGTKALMPGKTPATKPTTSAKTTPPDMTLKGNPDVQDALNKSGLRNAARVPKQLGMGAGNFQMYPGQVRPPPQGIGEMEQMQLPQGSISPLALPGPQTDPSKLLPSPDLNLQMLELLYKLQQAQ